MMSRAECGLAETEIDLGHLDRAASWIASAKSAMSHVPNQNPLYLEDCMEAEADVIDAQGNPTLATQIALQALALLEQAGATHDLRYSELLGRIADYYKETGDTHKGFEYVARALSAAERDGLGDTDAGMTAVHNVASSLIGFGELKEACSREARLVDDWSPPAGRSYRPSPFFTARACCAGATRRRRWSGTTRGSARPSRRRTRIARSTRESVVRAH